MVSAKIIFAQEEQLFRWLQLRNVDDRQTLCYRPVNNSQYQAIRLIGGCRWDPDDDEKPMIMFPGCSCHLESSGPNEVFDGSTCLFRKKIAWDEVNSMFVHEMEKKGGHSGFDRFSDVEEDTSTALSITWYFEDDLYRSVWSVDATQSGDTTLGTMEIIIPVVHVYGMRECGELERQMENFPDG